MTNANELDTPQLPPLNYRQQTFLQHYLQSGNASESYRIAGYKTKYSDRSAYILMNKDPIKSHIEWLKKKQSESVTLEWKLDKLREIVNRYINSDNPDVCIKAIAELNKMSGDYAPTQVDNRTINIQADLEDVRNARLEYKKDK
jgi:phage terminase small subunit